ncbi:MAG: hypothetical protein AB7N76_06080 [Planctomycetota bacterium]
MQIDPRDFHQIPDNRHGIASGCVLLPTEVPIVAGGGTSLQFVRDQGGDDDTFILLFGQRAIRDLLGQDVDILEGIFLSERGPGFHPTWDFDQLMRETDLGGWTVIQTDEVLRTWRERVETRINRS